MNRKQRRETGSRNASTRSADPILQPLLQEALRHHRAGQLAEAEKIYRQILAIEPKHADSLNLLGALANQLNMPDKAIELIEQAIRIDKNIPAYHNNLGTALDALRRRTEAIQSWRRALALDPAFHEAANNLGVALMYAGKLDEAKTHLERALAAHPDSAEMHNNLGLVLCEEGRRTEALDHFRRAIALKPDYAEAHWDEGVIALLEGRFAEGWVKHEWRWGVPDAKPHGIKVPLWDGGDLTGKTILLHGEQGFGDCIQFVRYAGMIKAKGATKVWLRCRAPLAQLFQTIDGVDEVFIEDLQTPPPFDCHAPLLSLPGLFHTTLETVPASVPYIRSDALLQKKWQDRLANLPGQRIGIVWRGNPMHKNDLNRSIAPRIFASFLKNLGISVINLQKDARPEEIKTLGITGPFLNAGPELENFADTAALISTLDLVITVDTALCHLTGALAVPVWTLLPFAPDWRWLLDRSDSPWYPTMRLFRQPKPGDWQCVTGDIKAELSAIGRSERV